jgi:energy-converting hydrogenase Eha subunit G
MNINTHAKFALIGLVYIYTSQLIDAFFHDIFRPAAFAGIIVGLITLAGIA